MKEKSIILQCLKQSPHILKGLIRRIPENRLRTHRIAGKWSIHEHACHLAQAEAMILDRFHEFILTDKPVFQPYIPGETIDMRPLILLNLEEEIKRYAILRKQLIELVSQMDESVWTKEARHNEYVQYNAEILLRHTLMHDHFHMYRIETLWLTKDHYL